jgi:1-acyl-sn-glycerol-3-phosphate acyltransferase
MLRTIFFAVILILETIIAAFFVIIASFFNPYSRFTTTIIRFWSFIILWAAGIKVDVLGKENMEEGESYIIVSNHQSHMDIPTALAAFPAAIRIISKKELFKVPVFGWGMRAAGILEIDRSNRKQAIETLKKAGTIIHQNHLSILAFPEGTRSPDDKIHAFKKGPFVLAINSQYPILPVSISGTRKILPKKKLRINSGKVKVQIHAPIFTAKMTLINRNKLVEETQKIVESGFVEGYS